MFPRLRRARQAGVALLSLTLLLVLLPQAALATTNGTLIGGSFGPDGVRHHISDYFRPLPNTTVAASISGWSGDGYWPGVALSCNGESSLQVSKHNFDTNVSFTAPAIPGSCYLYVFESAGSGYSIAGGTFSYEANTALAPTRIITTSVTMDATPRAITPDFRPDASTNVYLEVGRAGVPWDGVRLSCTGKTPPAWQSIGDYTRMVFPYTGGRPCRVEVYMSVGATGLGSGLVEYTDRTVPTVIAKTPLTATIATSIWQATFSEPVMGVSTSSFHLRAVGASADVAAAVSAVGTTGTIFKLTPTAALAAGVRYTARLDATIVDAAANALVPVSWSARVPVTIQNTAVVVSRFWDRDLASAASGGAYGAARLAGAGKTLSFTGASVNLRGVKGPDGGYADVYLDGVKMTTTPLNFYAKVFKYNQSMWTKTGLAGGLHRLEVRVRGSHVSASTGNWVYVDAFVVGTTTYQENNIAVTDTFRVITNAKASGSYDVLDHVAKGDTGSRPGWSIAFDGTGVDWYGLRTVNGGKANVYVDGILKATVSLYGSTTAYKVKLYSVAGLVEGTHALRIEAAGSAVTAAKGYEIYLDYVIAR